MKEKLFSSIAKLSARHPVWMVLGALTLTMIAGTIAEGLKMEMHFKNLMPAEHKMTKEFNKIIDDFSTATQIIVAAKGNEKELREFADEVAPKLAALKQHIQRVDYRLDRDFVLQHGFMLQKAKDLKNSRSIYKDLSLPEMISAINDNFERTYIDDDESMSNKEKENNAIAFLDGLKTWIGAMQQYTDKGRPADTTMIKEAVLRFLTGDDYYLSQDKDMLLMFARPTFNSNEVDKVMEAENTVDSILAAVAAKYPSIDAGTTGTMALMRDETEAIGNDSKATSIIAFALIIILFIISFRMWVSPLLAGISLIIGIVWAAGFAAITVGSLNIMTSMFAVILIGLGIDFSIHIISIFTELRAAGNDLETSLNEMLKKAGGGILIGGLTTALAFLTLIVSQSDGMKEFAIVTGSGVLFCMISAIVVLPSILALRDKIMHKISKNHRVRSTDFKALAPLSRFISAKPGYVLLVMFIITVGLFVQAMQITFDYNYLNMEPVGLKSIALQDEMEEEFDVTPDFSVLTTSSIEDARRIAEEAKDLKMIGMVSSISDFIPSSEQREKRRPYIEEIRSKLQAQQGFTPLDQYRFEALTDELLRLEDNIIEMAQLAFMGGQEKVDEKCREFIGNLDSQLNTRLLNEFVTKLRASNEASIASLNQFNADYEPILRNMATNMANSREITLETLPENIRGRFMSKDGSKNLVTVFPKDGIWKDMNYLARFTDKMQEIDDRATGMPMIFYVLIDIIAQDGKIAALLTITVVFLLLLVDFRSLKLALMAMVPLVIGTVWMVGIMQLLGLQLNMVNVIGIPLILGIGIDDGVHLLHRYKVEGRARLTEVFRSTGKAVILTSLTTMLAFGSLVFSTYRGFASLGITLFIGVLTCLLSSLFVLPALMKLGNKE